MTTLPTLPSTVTTAEQAIAYLIGGLGLLYPTLDKKEGVGGEAIKRVIVTPNVTDPDDFGKLLSVYRCSFSVQLDAYQGVGNKRPWQFVEVLGNLTFPTT